MIKQRDTYTYCTHCKAKLQKKQDYKVCPKCDKHYHFNAQPAVMVLLSDSQDRLLLTKREREPFKDWWDLPGGFVNEDETFEQAARREMKEETNIDVVELTYVGSFADDYEYRDAVISVTVAVFAGSVPADSSIAVGDDVSDYTFRPIKEIDFDKIAFVNQRAFAKHHFNLA